MTTLGLVSKQNTSNFSNLPSPFFLPFNLPTLPPLPSSAIHIPCRWRGGLSASFGQSSGSQWEAEAKWPSRNVYNTGLRPGAMEIVCSQSIQVLWSWSSEDAQNMVQGFLVHGFLVHGFLTNWPGSLRALPIHDVCAQCRSAVREWAVCKLGMEESFQVYLLRAPH